MAEQHAALDSEGMHIASATTPFSLQTTVRDGLAVVAVVGELDCATAPQLGKVLGGLADPGQVILVDLSDTEFLDCAGVGVLALPPISTSVSSGASCSLTHRAERSPESSN